MFTMCHFFEFFKFLVKIKFYFQLELDLGVLGFWDFGVLGFEVLGFWPVNAEKITLQAEKLTLQDDGCSEAE